MQFRFYLLPKYKILDRAELSNYSNRNISKKFSTDKKYYTLFLFPGYDLVIIKYQDI